MRKFRGVFIEGDCNIGYIYDKYSQKNVKKLNKNVQNQLKFIEHRPKNVCSSVLTTGQRVSVNSVNSRICQWCVT